MRLLLIRHGQTPSNVLGLLDTAVPGPGLTELGLTQAEHIPLALHGQTIDSIAASTLLRTQLTAAPLAADRSLEVVVHDGFREIDAGDLEKKSDPDSVRLYLETMFAWGAGDLDLAMPGGPDGHEFFDRFDRAMAEALASAPETAVVVSHGGAIRVWVAARAANIAPEFAAEHDLENTGIVGLDGSLENGWTLVSWADMPIGGEELFDDTAEDPTGESLSEARSEH